MPLLKVELNGTNKNPYHKFGLSQDPFPQISEYEKSRACLRLQSLGGNPIPDVEYIRDTLKEFSDEFVNLCCLRFKKGEYVTFEVEYK